MPEQDGDADRLVAALLLRDARAQADVAQEEGATSYLDRGRKAPCIDGRLLLGEVAQARSHNRVLHGVQPLPRLAAEGVAGRNAAALDLEFVRRAHELREAGAGRSAGDRSRDVEKECHSRGGGRHARSHGSTVLPSGRAVERRSGACEAASAPDAKRLKASVRDAGDFAAVSSIAAEGQAPVAGRRHVVAAVPVMPEQPEPWLSRGLRVRVVDAAGDLRSNHLAKGVVRRVGDGCRTADVELQAGGDSLRGVAEALLETVVSKDCRQVEIVRGPDVGMIAELIERDPKGNVAVIRLSRGHGSAQLRVRLDDVCEFA